MDRPNGREVYFSRGPVKYGDLCVECSEPIETGQRLQYCIECQKYIHKSCAHICTNGHALREAKKLYLQYDPECKDKAHILNVSFMLALCKLTKHDLQKEMGEQKFGKIYNLARKTGAISEDDKICIDNSSNPEDPDVFMIGIILNSMMMNGLVIRKEMKENEITSLSG